jgi:hypothetical protein
MTSLFDAVVAVFFRKIRSMARRKGRIVKMVTIGFRMGNQPGVMLKSALNSIEGCTKVRIILLKTLNTVTNKEKEACRD